MKGSRGWAGGRGRGPGADGRAGEGEPDLELARQALGVGVAQEVDEGGLGPGAHVEHLQWAGAGQRACGHVAHGVATGLASGQPGFGQHAQQGGGAAELDEVELDALAGGEVSEAPRELRGDGTEALELVGGKRSERRLYPHHHRLLALALAVDAVVQPDDAKGLLVELSAPVALEQLSESLDIGHDGRGGDTPGGLGGPHGRILPKVDLDTQHLL